VVAIVVLLVLVDCVVPVTPELIVVVTVAALPVVFWFSVGNVQFVSVPDEGVPKTGVTKVGLVDKTTFPDPVEVVTPVPPFATAKVPVTPVAKGKPVQFVNVPLVGVPSAGVTNVGLIKSALVVTAIAILANSVLISVPLRIFKGSPDVRASLVAKLVDCV
jgi:hypothetical protein